MGCDQIGFGQSWISQVKVAICTARVLVLVNGSSINQFAMEKGVRQGDPLSPYLFIIAIEGLISALKDAARQGLLRGVELPNKGSVLSPFRPRLPNAYPGKCLPTKFNTVTNLSGKMLIHKKCTVCNNLPGEC